MYLAKIDPQFYEKSQVLSAFYDDLPRNPYCSNAKGYCYIRTKNNAITHAYIQPNQPQIAKWLWYDIDRADATLAYHIRDLPPPTIVVKNSTNGHAHYGYRLAIEVGLSGQSRKAPIAYLEAVYKALGRALGADQNYSGNLIKNPLNSAHECYLTGANSYSLDELADYFLDLSAASTSASTSANDVIFGRNCATFEHTRHKAYRIAHKYMRYSDLYQHVLAIASAYNAQFDAPMFDNELHHIARSITRYCLSAKFVAHAKESAIAFSELQRHRASKGGAARSDKYQEQRARAQELHVHGMNKSQIAKQLKVSRQTVINWLKNN